MLIAFLFQRVSLVRANVRADAERAAKEALQTELQAVRDGMARDDKSAEVTGVARTAITDYRTGANQRRDKVKGYANGAADLCAADPDILRELAEGKSRVSAAESGLRGK